MPPEPIAPATPADAQRHGTLARAVRATSLMTLASRLGGLARDVIVGRMFGDVGVLNSAFNAAFAIPNMFRRLFGEGALSAAFIPEYTQTQKHDPHRADQLASLTMAALGVVTGVLTIIAEIVLLLLILFLPHDPERTLSLKLVMVMLPFMPLICMVAILAGMLQVHGKFAAAASGPVILNAFIIVAGLYFVFTGPAGETTAYILGVATVLSGVTQLAYFLKLLRPHVRWTRLWSDARPQAAGMLRKFVPVAIGLGTLQLNTFLDTLLAMWTVWVGPTMFGLAYPMDDKSNGILALTSRLYQFPLGVFGIAVATATFPLLARHAKEPAQFIDTLRRGLRLSLFIGLPATVGLILVRHDITAVMFGGGKTGWTADGLERSAAVLCGFSVGIWAYSLNQVLTRAFYAQGDTSTPMKISLAMIVLNIALNLTLIWPLREAGLAWATAASAVIQTLVLLALVSRMLLRVGTHTPILDGPFRSSAARILVATALMALAVWLTMTMLPLGNPLARETAGSWLHGPWIWLLARLAIATGIGGVVYVILSKVLKIAELSWLLHRSAKA